MGLKRCKFCNGSGKTNKNLVIRITDIGKNICKKCNGKGWK